MIKQSIACAMDCFYFDNNIGVDEFKRFVIFRAQPSTTRLSKVKNL